MSGSGPKRRLRDVCYSARKSNKINDLLFNFRFEAPAQRRAILAATKGLPLHRKPAHVARRRFILFEAIGQIIRDATCSNCVPRCRE